MYRYVYTYTYMYIYIQKRERKIAFWTVTQSLEEEKTKTWEGVETDETERDYKSYCLLLLERGWTSIPKFVVWTLSVCCCCCPFCLFLVCAVAMDSSKVGKCRIACCSCFVEVGGWVGRGGPKQKHAHTQVTIFHSLKMNWAPAFVRNVSLFFFFSSSAFLIRGACSSSVRGSQTIAADALCFASEAEKRRRVWPASPLVCFTIAPVRVSEPLQGGAGRGRTRQRWRDSTRAGGAGGTLSGEPGWYDEVRPQCSFQARLLDVAPVFSRPDTRK